LRADREHAAVPTKLSNPLLRSVGARIRKARRAAGISQEDLAGEAGLDRSFVSGLERGEHNVSLLVLARLARVLNVRVGRLVDDD
jgi:transcriptional regulator with XRE-family HTH domain